ncbi:Sec39 domain-containing protein [Microdochium trichocladiopsis]|uniref:Sec39 domain-containing protein n=1 Tax=Microdochium trichocladiopsis TaxID=1682393 RepID=A0A9P8Y927_9PEZI|nr:Sec39 domain-containing protein [Microdochium trichocladiopsis]KAH7032806.1 Sec39 domain-containing protein [Microdochium trichocladiopsis]
MSALLSAPRVVLLAVHLATKAAIPSLTALAAQHPHVLHKELLLRILLSVLPETLEPNHYVGLLERIESGDWEYDDEAMPQVDTASIDDLDDKDATKKVRRLKLLPLAWDGAPAELLNDSFSLFLIQRAHRIDEEAGLLTQLPDLVVPFLDHAQALRTWLISSLLPLLRRNCLYYPEAPVDVSLAAFQNLDDRIAVQMLLDQTGTQEKHISLVGRDLRGLVGPWLYDPTHWTNQHAGDNPPSEDGKRLCPAWEHVLEWFTTKASTSWKVVVSAIDQWDGPADADLGEYGSLWFEDEEQGYLEGRYARAVLACAYLIPEASVDALIGVNTIISKVMSLLDQDACPTLQVASSLLSPFTDVTNDPLLDPKNATFLRNDLLEDSNPLTTPSDEATRLLHALTLSAYILTKTGAPCSVRRAGELAFLQDEREQKAEAMRMIRSFSSVGPKNDDKYWLRARDELLWLRDWGAEEDWGAAQSETRGVLGQLKKEFLEVECLKAFLSNTRYSLARSIYEEPSDKILDSTVLRDTIVNAAMAAYDNATNPHRGRGGLLKCHDIIHAFPETIPQSSPEARRIESLLRATHALGEYRLVLKQGEPFTPVVLRVHADPVSIVQKVLEQNPKSYTKIQDFLEIGSNMVSAGLVAKKDQPEHVKTRGTPSPGQLDEQQQQLSVEQRITAMCVDAALTEDDFETAYSYVVNRLATSRYAPPQTIPNIPSSKSVAATPQDDYSWKAALQAGRYRRTEKTIRPTHIGTASGNLDIRHLEQRIECLSTALRIAPASTLQEILNVFRKCEEELNAAIKAEEASESAWDDTGAHLIDDSNSTQAMPGGFSSTVPAGVGRSGRPTRPGLAATASSAAEEAPMSLFDLSRASIARAQRTLPALASLQRGGSTASNKSNKSNASTSRFSIGGLGSLAGGIGGGGGGAAGSDNGMSSSTGTLDDGSSGHGRAGPRKRDQLREAAVGTLASGVGWLIGAQPAAGADRRQYGEDERDDDHD